MAVSELSYNDARNQLAIGIQLEQKDSAHTSQDWAAVRGEYRLRRTFCEMIVRLMYVWR
jgi:hypothetical protein